MLQVLPGRWRPAGGCRLTLRSWCGIPSIKQCGGYRPIHKIPMSPGPVTGRDPSAGPGQTIGQTGDVRLIFNYYFRVIN